LLPLCYGDVDKFPLITVALLLSMRLKLAFRRLVVQVIEVAVLKVFIVFSIDLDLLL
jgi:hypothetical protein